MVVKHVMQLATLGSLPANEIFIAVRMLIADVQFSPAHAQRVGNHLQNLEILP